MDPQILDLSRNYLTGPITLPAISSLRVSSNFFSGPLPDGACQARNFDANCFTLPSDCSLVVQRKEAACNAFCGISSAATSSSADASAAACAGVIVSHSVSQPIVPPTTVLTKGTVKETGGKFTAAPVTLFVFEEGQAMYGCGAQLAFQVNFTVAILPRSGPTGSGGFAFVISSTDQLGSGSGVGYSGMDSHSIAVEFDTQQDKQQGDMLNQHVGLNIQGQERSLAAVKAPFPLNNKKPYTAWVDYEPGEPGTIQVFLAASEVKPVEPLLERRVALCEVLQAGAEQQAFFFGFVASTAKPFQMQLILRSAMHTGLPAAHNPVGIIPHASWAYAVVASVEAAYGIALNQEAPQLSVDSLFAAMGLTSLAAKCTTGNSPAAAFEKLLTLLRGGFMGFTNSGVERTQFKGYVGLMLAVRRQPVVVHIEASASTFVQYDGGGDGVCGINVLPGIYPIVKIPKDLCGQKSYKGVGDLQPIDMCGSYPMNPCAVGTCVNDGKGAYSCICPPNYIESRTVYNSSTCDPANTTATTLTVTGANWWCSDILSATGLSLASLPQQTMGDSCSSISTQLGISSIYLISLNPSLDCSKPIKAGHSLCLERNATFAFTTPKCLQYGMLTAQDTCEGLLQEALESSEEEPEGPVAVTADSWIELYRNNPGLICPRTIPASSATVASVNSVQVCLMADYESLIAHSCKQGRLKLVSPSLMCGGALSFYGGAKRGAENGP
ncbi:unnamed protein product [Closterium sp. NIES-64]|nr:unnamed protein product [Closterium sp. NIES-64]